GRPGLRRSAGGDRTARHARSARRRRPRARPAGCPGSQLAWERSRSRNGGEVLAAWWSSFAAGRGDERAATTWRRVQQCRRRVVLLLGGQVGARSDDLVDRVEDIGRQYGVGRRELRV